MVGAKARYLDFQMKKSFARFESSVSSLMAVRVRGLKMEEKYN